MRLLTAYRRLGPVDLKNVRRDALLAWVVLLPVGLALLLRFGVPPLEGWLMERSGFDLAPYHPLLMSFFVMTAPAVIGMVFGFLLLDERDDRLLTAVMVTPLSLDGYLRYRLSVPLLPGFLVTVACYPLAGLAPVGPGALLAVAAVASASGSITALFLAAFAENKVSGFATVKIVNSINMVPVAGYFLPMPWELAAGLVPAYWPMKMLWQAAAGQPWWPFALAGVAVNAAAIWLLAKRFRGVIRDS
jgi:fluoroquinolone transport system permease protein